MHGRVLIVDDEPTALKTVDRILARAGFETSTAPDGLKAQEALCEKEYDVAIIDLLMPQMDGLQVLEWMRTHCPKVIPIVLSGTSRLEDAVRAVQEGAFDFVSKPIESFQDFIQHIGRAVEHKQLRDAHDRLLGQLQEKNIELENRLSQLELAHSILQSQAVAIHCDLNRAMRIQQGLLPKELPFADRISIATVYQPQAKVGGDLYDFFRLDDRSLGFMLADTSGHGVSSALLTVFLKHALDGVLASKPDQPTRDPGEVLIDLNQTIINEAFGQGIFVSMIYAVLDVESGEVKYSFAGHPPMFVKRADGHAESYRRPAPVLGVNPKVAYTSDCLHLAPGELLVLYTDGVPEARSMAGEFFGDQRLQAAISSAENHADSLASAIEHELATFCEGRQRTDDCTLLVLGMEPQRKPFQAPVPEEKPVRSAPAGQEPSLRVHTARHDGRTFISITGTGTWRESQQLLTLCDEARAAGEKSIVVDLSHCAHLDSTFLGVLHNIASGFDKDESCRFEIQNLPRPLLQEMSTLGLTNVLMHFRHEPVALPESMLSVEGGAPAGEELGRLLLWAHEALVDADPSNADRFANVLAVLHQRARNAAGDGIGPRPARETEPPDQKV